MSVMSDNRFCVSQLQTGPRGGVGAMFENGACVAFCQGQQHEYYLNAGIDCSLIELRCKLIDVERRL
jgi:hypothetical protein